MTLSFPNTSRSYDENHHRVRFTGYDGMFEVKFFVTSAFLSNGHHLRSASESDYLDAFDRMRTKILDLAKRAYNSKRQSTIVLDAADL